MQHTLITPQSPGEQLAALAAGALDMASRQQTGNIGSVTIPTAGGTKLIAGEAAGLQGIAPWVGDTTAPSMPTGIGVDSAAGMILVTWDGSLQDGIPADFDHIQVLVDGTEAGRMTARGTLAMGPYEVGSTHSVSAVAWDDAHGEDGNPAPNGSPATQPVQIVVSGADIDPKRLGIDRTKSDTPPQGEGKHRGDLWMQYGPGEKPALVAEWWWDGSGWVQIPVAMYLDQLAARDVQVDAAVIGLICAGIIRSGSFTTPDGLVGFDESGFWAKGKDGKTLFKASGNGVQTVGGMQTAASGDRIQLSQTLIQGTNTGGLQGIGDDPAHPYWLIWGDHDGLASRLMMGTSPQQPQISASIDSDGHMNASLTADDVHLTADDVWLRGSKGIHLDSDAIWLRGVRLPVSGIATGGYTHHQGAWEISFKQAATRYGGQAFTTGGNPGQTYGVQGLRIPCAGYWMISGAVNVTGTGNSATLGLGVYHEASGKIDTYWDGFVLDFTLSPSKWVSQAIPATLEYLYAGDVLMWRSTSGLTAGGGANYMIATLMPF